MAMRAGGTAADRLPDTQETLKSVRELHLRAELEQARRHSLAMNARFGLLLRDPECDLEEIAQVAEDGAQAAGRIAGLARMLARSLAQADVAAMV
jgi:hypothetical protein